MEPTIYHIPVNFKEPGQVLNGTTSIRNAIDAVVLALLGVLLATAVPVANKLGLVVLLGGFFGMFGLVGIRGIPVSDFLFTALRWLRNRKPKMYNYHGGVYSMSSADLMLQQPQLRDTVAGIVEKISKSMAGQRVNYVEGENFEFSYDPEMEALKLAQERAEEEQSGPQNTAAKPADAMEHAPSTGINIVEIIDNLDISNS